MAGAVVLAVGAVDAVRGEPLPRPVVALDAAPVGAGRAGFSVLSIGRLPRQGEPARRHGLGEVLAEPLGPGGAPVGGDAHGPQGDDLPGVQAALARAIRPRSRAGAGGSCLSRKRWCSAGASSSDCASRRKEFVVEAVLGRPRVHQGVPAAWRSAAWLSWSSTCRWSPRG